jgi:2-polyprenyl-3-methyl-5-hydroxy-6-metoxy-1,4-benzoquinol methylase
MKQTMIAHPGPPSKALMGVADEISSISQLPVLDAGCGFGRNAVALASRGLSVVCVDRNRDCLNSFTGSASIHNTGVKPYEYVGGHLHPVNGGPACPRDTRFTS